MVGKIIGLMGNTKASVLQFLSPRLKSAFVDNLFVMTVRDWQTNHISLINQIARTFINPIIVRSSAIDEDQSELSSTGKYKSVQFVNPHDRAALEYAINYVIESYESKGNYNKENEILIQEQVIDPEIAGIVFTREPKNNAPYYIAEYDETGKTDTITGYGRRKRRVIFRRELGPKTGSKRFDSLVAAIQEIEQILKNDCLIIEFAITSDQQVHLFQAKLMPPRVLSFPVAVYQDYISNFQREIDKLMDEGTILSNMADWNPAEILGRSPSAFSISLYQTIVTDDTWYKARARLGYKTVEHSLMFVAAARPYINVKYSLYSLLPASMPQELSKLIVEKQLEQLNRDPSLHDKIEFKIAISTEAFSKTRLESLLGTLYELPITIGIINDWFVFNRNLIDAAQDRLAKISEVTLKLNELEDELNKSVSILKPCQLYTTLNQLKILGVIPFAELARLAFWGKSFLDWLKLEGALDNNEYSIFFGGLKSISFGNVNGVLRPNTYDISSLPYKVSDTLFNAVSTSDNLEKIFANDEVSRLTQQFLLECNSSVDTYDFFRMIHNVIRYRELLKFKFTQVLSAIIEQYARWGEANGMDRHKMALFTIGELCNFQEEVGYFSREASRKRLQHKLCHGIILPDVIESNTDLMDFEIAEAKPNYIISSKVSAPPVYLDATSDRASSDLLGKIVVIEAADPGYDWIFLHGIKGLVTKYGGMGSHMAIRCYEYRICAAIGCGDIIFEQLLNASEIVIDGQSELVYSILL